MIFFSEVTSLVPNPLAKKCIVNSRWLGTVLAFYKSSGAAKTPRQTRSEFWWRTSGHIWCFFQDHCLSRSNTVKCNVMLKCIEYVWDVCVFKTLWYACQELSTLGWGQRAFAGQRHWEFQPTLKLPCDLLPKPWLIKTWNANFSHRKFIALNHLEVSPNKRDLESNLLIPQEIVSYVMFFLHKSRCLLSESPVPQFAKSLFVTSLRSSLRRSMETSTSQLCQMA